LGPFGRIVFLGEVFKLCQIRTKYKKNIKKYPLPNRKLFLKKTEKLIVKCREFGSNTDKLLQMMIGH
jgi:hypothetical protein